MTLDQDHPRLTSPRLREIADDRPCAEQPCGCHWLDDEPPSGQVLATAQQLLDHLAAMGADANALSIHYDGENGSIEVLADFDGKRYSFSVEGDRIQMILINGGDSTYQSWPSAKGSE